MGSNYELLKKAINEKKKISYKYKDDEVREGFPYVLYYNDSKTENQGKIFLTIYREKNSEFDWRGYDIQQMSNIKILDITLKEIHKGYNPNSKFYSGGILVRI
jgi:hypothetical protein